MTLLISSYALGNNADNIDLVVSPQRPSIVTKGKHLNGCERSSRNNNCGRFVRCRYKCNNVALLAYNEMNYNGSRGCLL